MKKINSKFLLSFFLFTSVITSVLAMPAYPRLVEFTQPDGSKINVYLKGDENVKWAETPDGFSLMFNKDGYYEYAKIDTRGDMIPSGIRANNVRNRTESEKTFLASVQKNLKYNRNQVHMMKQITNIYNTQKRAFPTIGSTKLVCILMGFTDLAFTKTQADFNNLFNQVGYTTGGAAGSVKDFFAEASYNQFDLTVTVAGPYTAANNMAYYGGNQAGNDKNPDILASEAVTLADADVNYANFDNDNNGSVDAVYIIYAGYGEEAGGPANAIWAHAWSFATVTLDGKNVSTYSCSSELRGSTGTNMTRIGVICHEFGHTLGAPDFYDTDYATGGDYDGTGSWDLQAGGSWNGASGDGASPAHPNAYTKCHIYNWATEVIVSTAQALSLQDATTNSSTFYRYDTPTSNEFFLLENRQQTGFNTYCPGHGLLVYHADGTWIAAHDASNDLNNTSHQGMYIEPASSTVANGIAVTPSAVNTTGCPFPGTSSKTTFSDTSTPNSKSWAAANTAKPLLNITETSGVINLNFISAAPSLTLSQTTLTGFTYSAGSGPSANQTYTLSGANLSGTGNITVTGSTNYEVSTNASTYASSVTYPYASGIITGQPKNVYVRLKAGLSANSYNSETISNAGGTATTVNVTCSGTVTAPDVTPPSVSTLNPIDGATGVVLTSNLVLTFNENVQVGTAGNIVIYNSVGTVFETIPYNDSRITFSTNTVTINPTASFVVDASYYVQISNTAIKDAAGNAYAGISDATTWNFTAAPVTYCTSNGNGADTYLAVVRNVTLGTINNSSAQVDNAYSDYTSISTNLTQASSYNLSVSLATDGNYTYNCAVWIDWNRDGDFLDASENYSLGTVINNNLGTTSLSPLSITVPTIATGTTRMRVSMKYNAAPASCDIGFDGEVEDYTVNVNAVVATPTLTVSASTLTGFTYVSGSGPSTSQTYNLSGTDLTGFPSNIAVTAPTNYEVSTNNSTFAASVNVAYASATLASTPIYVRLKSGLAVASYNSVNVTNAGGGASTVNVTCSGSVTAPPVAVLSVSAGTLSGFTYISGSGPSLSQFYDLSGTNLTGFPSNIIVTAPANFEVSTDNSTFASSVNIAYASATLASTPIYVRLKAGLAIASYNSEIVANAGGGATTVNVTCSGTVTSLTYCTASSLNIDEHISNVSLGTIANASVGTNYSDFTANSTDLAIYSTTSISVQIVSSYTTDQILIWIDWNQNGDFSDAGENILTSALNGTNGNIYAVNIVVPADAVVGSTRMRIRLHDTAYGPNATSCGTADYGEVEDYTINVISNAAISSNLSTLSGFGYEFGSSVSASQSFNLSGSLLLSVPGNVVVTAPTNYEVSNDDITFSPSVNIAYATENLASTPIYVRLKTGLAVSLYSNEDIVCSGGGASSINVTCSGEVTAAATTACATDLLISEYHEPSVGNNKGVEVINKTGNAVDLSNYWIGTITNGGIDVEASINLVGTLNDGETVCIYNDLDLDANFRLKGNVNITWASATWNGDDAIYLLKGGNTSAFIIDAIGTLPTVVDPGTEFIDNGISTLNTTIVRNSTVTSPTTTWSGLEWTSSVAGTYTDWGIHTMNCGLVGNEDIEISNNIRVYPNPTTGKVNIKFENLNSDTKINIFDLTGKLIIEKEISAKTSITEFDLSKFTKGVYLMKISNKENVKIEKIIVE